MTVLQLVVLALVQGLTEFLPISSSAHLILGSRVFGWPDQGLAFDVATHLGTLLAVVVYFRRDLWSMVHAWRPGPVDTERRHRRDLSTWLALASVPALAVGWLAAGWVEAALRDLRVIAAATLFFGALLWAADARGARGRTLTDMTWRSAMWIGLAQVLALIPGTSRSGITITMGRALGFDAPAAARFSFLLAIPIIAAAGGYGAWQVARGTALIDWNAFAAALILSALAGWMCIAAFLALLERVGLLPFILYRMALGLALVWLLW